MASAATPATGCWDAIEKRGLVGWRHARGRRTGMAWRWPRRSPRDRVAAAQAAVLGPQEAARGIAAARSETALAGALDDWRSAAAPRAEPAAPPAPASGAADPTVSAGARAK